ncbi:MAG TPA: hypothetical protein VJB99_02510 [Patescibacteria group bacterium]|nr:hypothetical protein [Patescibacteria group bacterium]
MRPLIIGLSGLSGSGKSTLGERLEQTDDRIVRLRFDAFYKDAAECPRKGSWLLWDDPDSFLFEEGVQALEQLKEGKDVLLPVYSRPLSCRTGFVSFPVKPIILCEGYFLFVHERLRSLFDLRLWLDVPPATALARRRSRQANLDMEYFAQIMGPLQETVHLPSRMHAHQSIDGTRSPEEVVMETKETILSFAASFAAALHPSSYPTFWEGNPSLAHS